MYVRSYRSPCELGEILRIMRAGSGREWHLLREHGSDSAAAAAVPATPPLSAGHQTATWKTRRSPSARRRAARPTRIASRPWPCSPPARTHEQRQEYDTRPAALPAGPALRSAKRGDRRGHRALGLPAEVRGRCAVRYGLKAAELGVADPTLLRHLGIYFTGKDDFKLAMSLLRKGDGRRGMATRTTSRPIVTRMELGRLCHLLGKYQQGRHAVRPASSTALDHPADSA